MTQMRIGYIGLGTMGAPMALNILKAGFPLTVFNRTPSKATDLIAAGARWADTPGEVASRTEVVFTNLSDTPDVLHVLFGPNGVIEGSHPGMILVDNSTIKPSASREIYHRFHEVGVSTLDAPVSGGDIGARNGTLAIMVGGEAEAHLPAATFPSVPGSPRQQGRRWRLVSIFRHGGSLIVTALFNHQPLPIGHGCPEPWPTLPMSPHLLSLPVLEGET